MDENLKAEDLIMLAEVLWLLMMLRDCFAVDLSFDRGSLFGIRREKSERIVGREEKRDQRGREPRDCRE